MKKGLKRILIILVAIIATFMVLSFSACKKDNTEPSVSVSEEIEEQKEVKEEPKVEKEELKEEIEEEAVEERISFSIGNDIGQDIVALQIKPEENSQWSVIPLEKIWASGYMIPVTLTSSNLPDDTDWEINITFDDETEETFKGVKITDGADLILVPGEVIY
ncbi:MAG: hypothetical protein IKU80_04890 [Firmicutes bacterium]|nr:hypothetical protein [Bacillota bacterium]